MNKECEVISPTHPSFQDIKKAVNYSPLRTRFNYKPFFNAYNSAAVGSILLIGTPTHLKTSSVARVLENHGVKLERDLQLVKVTRDASGQKLPKSKQQMSVTKLTNSLLGKATVKS